MHKCSATAAAAAAATATTAAAATTTECSSGHAGKQLSIPLMLTQQSQQGVQLGCMWQHASSMPHQARSRSTVCPPLSCCWSVFTTPNPWGAVPPPLLLLQPEMLQGLQRRGQLVLQLTRQAVTVADAHASSTQLLHRSESAV